MYTPKPNEETRVEVMHELIRAHPLGTWTLPGADDLLTHHVPFLLDAVVVPEQGRARQGGADLHYAVVLVRGVPAFIHDREWLLAHVSSLTDAHEAAEPAPWAVADAQAAYVERQLGAIVGVEIPIERLLGKRKASQNRPDADRAGVVAGLERRGDGASAELVARRAED